MRALNFGNTSEILDNLLGKANEMRFHHFSLRDLSTHVNMQVCIVTISCDSTMSGTDKSPSLSLCKRELRTSTRGIYLFALQSASHRISGGLASLLNAILLHNHSTASWTPVPVSALQGSTLLSLTLPPFSPSKTLLTNPSLILTTSTQSSRSCLFASINIGTPLASSFCSTLSRTSLHSSSRPMSSFMAASCAERSARVALPTSLLSMTKTMA